MTTLRRGETIFRDGNIVAEPGSGRLLDVLRTVRTRHDGGTASRSTRRRLSERFNPWRRTGSRGRPASGAPSTRRSGSPRQDALRRLVRGGGVFRRARRGGQCLGPPRRVRGRQAIVSGSHVDTQSPGGRFDGALGIIAGCVAVAALKERFGHAAPAARRRLAGGGGGEPLSDREFWGSRAIIGAIGAGRAGRPASTSTASRWRRRCARPASIPTASRARPATTSRPSSSCTSSRDRARTGGLPVASSSGSSATATTLVELRGDGEPLRHLADGPPARPDGRRRRDHQRRHQHGAPDGAGRQ